MPDDPSFDRTLIVELSQTAFGRVLTGFHIDYFDATLEGAERIPAGGVLLVGWLERLRSAIPSVSRRRS